MVLGTNSSKNIRIEEIIRSLEALEAAASGAANRNPRLGLRNAIKFLRTAEENSLDQFIKALEAQKSAAASKRKTYTKPRQEIIAKHAGNLERAGTSNSEFERALNTLRNDSQVRLVELKRIVEEYSNAKQSLRSKSKGYDILEQMFDHRWKLANR